MTSLEEVIGWELCASELGYCHQNSGAFSQFNNKSGLQYWDWEKQTAEPKLKELGYTILSWRDGERDSFGPLSRVVVVKKDGVRSEMWYG